MNLSYKEFEGKKFYYLDFGSESHGRTSFRLWINRRLIQKNEEGKEIVEFPAINARIERTPKENYVLRPAEGYTTFDIYVSCGYRGGSSIEILRPEPEIVLDYFVYRSPRGSLGVSCGKVVSVKGSEIIYKWSKSGRLYGAPGSGITRVTADGKEESLDVLPDGLEAIQELEEALE